MIKFKRLQMPTILSQKQIDHYYDTGYLHVKGVYTEAQVDELRGILAKSIDNGTWESAPHYNEGVTTDIFRTMPELVDLIFTDRYIQVFKDLLGDKMVVLPEPAIHRNRFYYWHKDSTFIDEQGEDYHWNEDFQAVMAAMYLQDNDDEYGGGLTVVPKTQHVRDQYHKIPNMNIIERAFLKLQKLLKISFFDKLENHPQNMQIQSMKGDVVILDIRLDHKGTTPKKKRLNYDKFAYFNFITSDRKYVDKIINTMRSRPSKYFTEYLQHDTRLPDSVLQKSKELNFDIDF